MPGYFRIAYGVLVFTALLLGPHFGYANITFDEVMYDLPGSDDGREWIEVTNTGTDTVDLTGWKLSENNTNHSLVSIQGGTQIAPLGFAVIADNPQKFLHDWPLFSGMLFDSAFSLSNNGEPLALKDNHGVLIDSITYDTTLGAAGDGHVLALLSSGWTTRAPTPGIINETIIVPHPSDLLYDEDTPPEEETTIEDPELPDLPPAPVSSPAGDENPPPTDDTGGQAPLDSHVVINEIMYDAPGSDSGHEWIELANSGPYRADLTNWKFFENDTDHRLTLIQGSGSIGAAEFAVIADDASIFLLDHPDYSGVLFDSTFSFANTGESIMIKDGESIMQDTVVYDPHLGASGDSHTLSRFDNAWSIGLATPGLMNTLFIPDESEAPNPDGGVSESLPPISPIIIDEIAWMGVEGNQYGEWIELYNPNDTAIDLAGWKLYKDGGEAILFTLSKIIQPHSYLVIERITDSRPDPLPSIDDEAGTFGDGGLSNDGEQLVLKDLYGRDIQNLDFSHGWSAGDNDSKKTMQVVDGNWITATSTPGAVNIPDASSLKSDSGFGDSQLALIESLSEKNVLQVKDAISSRPLTYSILIEDTQSFLWIINDNEKDIDISDMQITDRDTSFTIPVNTIVKAKSSIVLAPEQLQFALADRVTFENGIVVLE